jgi:transcriptional regulatory protein RtcR
MLLQEVLGAERAARLDLFDSAQLACVIRTCRASSTLSEAGRRLFAVTRGNRKVTNDADRLRKYLARFGLAWGDCSRPRA